MTKNEILKIEKNIKRLNERINALGRTFGTENKQYKKAVSLLTTISSEHTKKGKSGYYALSHGKKFIESLKHSQIEEIEKTLNKNITVGATRKKAKQKLQEKGRKVTKKEIDTYIKEKDIESNLVEDNTDILYNDEIAQNILHITGRRKTRNEWEYIEDLVGNAYEIN